MSCHLKYFETVNKITPKIYDFILKFHNTKLQVVTLIIYMMKYNLLILILILEVDSEHRCRVPVG
jgi:hypothetical protein